MGDELVLDASVRETAEPAGDDLGEPAPDGSVEIVTADERQADRDLLWHAEGGRPIVIVPYPRRPEGQADADTERRPPIHPRRDLV